MTKSQKLVQNKKTNEFSKCAYFEYYVNLFSSANTNDWLLTWHDVENGKYQGLRIQGNKNIQDRSDFLIPKFGY